MLLVCGAARGRTAPSSRTPVRTGAGTLVLALAGVLVTGVPTPPAQASDETVAQLEAQLATATGAERLGVLQRLGELLLAADPERAAGFAASGQTLAIELHDRRGEAAASFLLGEVDRVRDRYEEAGSHYETARRLYAQLGDTRQRARATRRLGDVFFFLRGWERALKLYLEALELFGEVAAAENTPHARLQVGHVYSALGNVLRPTRDLEQALVCYRRALDVYQVEGFTAGLAGAYTNIGSVLQEQGRLDEALEANARALDAAQQANDLYALSIALANSGSVHLERGDLARARRQFDESLAMCERERRTRGIMEALIKLGELERRQGNTRKAMVLLDRAGALAERLADPQNQAEVLAQRSEILVLQGDHAGALAAFKQAESIRSQLLDAAKARQLTELRLAHEAQSRDREIELLRREREVVLLQRALLLAGVVAAAGLTLLLYGRYRLKVRTSEELAQAYRRVEELSRTDELTGLPNRRAIRERLDSEQAQAVRTRTPLTTMLADLDNFKQINDLYGHDCGDTVLRAVTDRLRAGIRGHDLVGRWGGEEFLFVLPGTSAPTAATVAERVRLAVGEAPFACNHDPIVLTMTFGVCQLDEQGVEACLRGADRAMYEGKAGGKNRVVIGNSVSDDSEVSPPLSPAT